MPKSLNAQDARVTIDGKPIEPVGHDFGFDRPPRPKKRIAIGGPATGLTLKDKKPTKPPAFKRPPTKREKRAESMRQVREGERPPKARKRVAFA